MPEKIIVERIFGEFAICEQQDATVEVPLDLLPDHVRVGDVYYRTPTGWELDPEEVERRRRLVSDKYDKLFGEK